MGGDTQIEWEIGGESGCGARDGLKVQTHERERWNWGWDEEDESGVACLMGVIVEERWNWRWRQGHGMREGKAGCALRARGEWFHDGEEGCEQDGGGEGRLRGLRGGG